MLTRIRKWMQANPLMRTRIRKWMQANSLFVTFVAALVIFGALSYIYMLIPDGTPAAPVKHDMYFYDVNSIKTEPLERLFVVKGSELPPVPSPTDTASGNTQSPHGVKAYVFACGDCTDSSKRFIGFLETYTKEAKDALIGLGEKRVALIEEGHFVASVEHANDWVRFHSPEGRKITRGDDRCAQANLQAIGCYPQ